MRCRISWLPSSIKPLLRKMDFCLCGKNNGIQAADLNAAVELDTHQVQRVYDAIQARRKVARYRRAAWALVGGGFGGLRFGR